MPTLEGLSYYGDSAGLSRGRRPMRRAARVGLFIVGGPAALASRLAWKRHKKHQAKRRSRIAQRTAGAAPSLAAAEEGTGAYDDLGLGKSRFFKKAGRSIRKVTKTKAFKILGTVAAIAVGGALAYKLAPKILGLVKSGFKKVKGTTQAETAQVAETAQGFVNEGMAPEQAVAQATAEVAPRLAPIVAAAIAPQYLPQARAAAAAAPSGGQGTITGETEEPETGGMAPEADQTGTIEGETAAPRKALKAQAAGGKLPGWVLPLGAVAVLGGAYLVMRKR